MFESVLCAQKAKAALNGADIYAGCCTLKIEYARVSISTPHQRNIYAFSIQFKLTYLLRFQQPTRLNVIRNDNDSWDYTKPYLGRRGRYFTNFRMYLDLLRNFYKQLLSFFWGELVNYNENLVSECFCCKSCVMLEINLGH